MINQSQSKYVSVNNIDCFQMERGEQPPVCTDHVQSHDEVVKS